MSVTRDLPSAGCVRRLLALVILVTLVTLASCAGILPHDPPPLAALEEPFRFLAEPDDEAARAALEPGAFTGVSVADARRSLEALAGEPEGLVITRIAENSPAVAAGLEVGDLLLEASFTDGAGMRATRVLRWPSDWRALELEAAVSPATGAGSAGSEVELVLERAGVELDLRLALVPRLRPAARIAAQRFVEDRRVGVVLRTATEVEARAALLPPGAGAVVVGLARESPWRAAGLRFEDLITAVDGAPLADPQALLDAVRAAQPGARLALSVVRPDGRPEGQPGGTGGLVRLELEAPVSRRARETKELKIPLLFSFERDGERTTTSLLLGVLRWERTPATWRLRLLWLLRFARGDASRLEEVDG